MHRPSLAAVLLPLLAPVALAQGASGGARAPGASVQGRLSIAERGGAPTRDVADAVVWLVPAAGAALAASATPAPPAVRRAAAVATPPRPAEILMQGRQFTPRVRVVPAGTTIEFPNGDPFRHNAFSNSAPGAFDLGLYGKGERRGVAPAKPGVYAIYCDIHARMRAHLVVVPTAHWTQPGVDGRFALADVPPGRYVLRAWHERGGETSRDVVVTPAGVEATLALDARGFAVQPHKNKFGRDYPTRSGDRY